VVTLLICGAVAVFASPIALASPGASPWEMKDAILLLGIAFSAGTTVAQVQSLREQVRNLRSDLRDVIERFDTHITSSSCEIHKRRA
jgi:hypothetical protein